MFFNYILRKNLTVNHDQSCIFDLDFSILIHIKARARSANHFAYADSRANFVVAGLATWLASLSDCCLARPRACGCWYKILRAWLAWLALRWNEVGIAIGSRASTNRASLRQWASHYRSRKAEEGDSIKDPKGRHDNISL